MESHHLSANDINGGEPWEGQGLELRRIIKRHGGLPSCLQIKVVGAGQGRGDLESVTLEMPRNRNAGEDLIEAQMQLIIAAVKHTLVTIGGERRGCIWSPGDGTITVRSEDGLSSVLSLHPTCPAATAVATATSVLMSMRMLNIEFYSLCGVFPDEDERIETTAAPPENSCVIQ